MALNAPFSDNQPIFRVFDKYRHIYDHCEEIDDEYLTKEGLHEMNKFALRLQVELVSTFLVSLPAVLFGPLYINRRVTGKPWLPLMAKRAPRPMKFAVAKGIGLALMVFYPLMAYSSYKQMKVTWHELAKVDSPLGFQLNVKHYKVKPTVGQALSYKEMKDELANQI